MQLLGVVLKTGSEARVAFVSYSSCIVMTGGKLPLKGSDLLLLLHSLYLQETVCYLSNILQVPKQSSRKGKLDYLLIGRLGKAEERSKCRDVCWEMYVSYSPSSNCDAGEDS